MNETEHLSGITKSPLLLFEYIESKRSGEICSRVVTIESPDEMFKIIDEMLCKTPTCESEISPSDDTEEDDSTSIEEEEITPHSFALINPEEQVYLQRQINQRYAFNNLQLAIDLKRQRKHISLLYKIQKFEKLNLAVSLQRLNNYRLLIHKKLLEALLWIEKLRARSPSMTIFKSKKSQRQKLEKILETKQQIKAENLKRDIKNEIIHQVLIKNEYINKYLN